MFRHSVSRAAFVLVGSLLAAAAGADVITVANTDDDGAGSLRAAIAAAVSGDAIHFAIEEGGVQTITPVTALPPIAAGVTIDGTTQSDASCATWPPTLRIEISGYASPQGSDGLSVTGNDVVVRGLILNSFTGDAIEVNGASGNVYISCNFIGTDASGTQDFGNAGAGVRLVGTRVTTIGGAMVSERNLIAANAIAGVWIDENASANSVSGNYIGTDVSGAVRLDNFNGVVVHGANNLLLGNLISGNVESGVLFDVATATGNTVVDNLIGANATDTAAIPNGGAGVYLLNGATLNTVGAVGAGNRFRANGANGVWVDGAASLRNSIRGNSMTGNGAIGIELGAFFENPNDPGDPDAGPNRLQNTPVLIDVAYAAGLNQVTATFSVPTETANATYPLQVDFYGADEDDEEGEFYLGTLSYDASDFIVGTVTRSFTPAATVTAGDEVVATATDAAGNTSEFTATAITVVVPEPAALATGAIALAALTLRPRRWRVPDAGEISEQ